VTLFGQLATKQFVVRVASTQRLLQSADPTKVTYSLLLYERTPLGNLLRVQADSLEQPFDVNEGLKLELGSTAKLRTLSHYLELVRSCTPVADERAGGAGRVCRRKDDPLSQWVAETMLKQPGIGLEGAAAGVARAGTRPAPTRRFSPAARRHVFNNFDKRDNGKKFTIREALWRSSNLVFVRVMRDLVRFPRGPVAVRRGRGARQRTTGRPRLPRKPSPRRTGK